MRLSAEEILADEKRMKEYICKQLPRNHTSRVILSVGQGGKFTWADLHPTWNSETGWDLDVKSNDPQVGLEEVYDHFRLQDMTFKEYQQLQEDAKSRQKPHWDGTFLLLGDNEWHFRNQPGPVRSLLDAFQADNWNHSSVKLDHLDPDQVRDARKILRLKTQGFIIWKASNNGTLSWSIP